MNFTQLKRIKMEALLKKIGNEYKLYAQDDSCIATTQESPHKRLSKQNCDEIFGVVDVEKLANEFTEHFNTFYGVKSDVQVGYKSGFNKAMELNKDKLFTVEDMKKAYIQGKHGGKTQSYVEFDEFIQLMLQQPTEIEIEIDTKPFVSIGFIIADFSKDVPIDILKVEHEVAEEVLNLDENGCLILKKKL